MLFQSYREILTKVMVIEDEFNSGWDIGEDIEGEDDDDQEGPEVTEAIHDNIVSRRKEWWEVPGRVGHQDRQPGGPKTVLH